eukprot:1163_1
MATNSTIPLATDKDDSNTFRVLPHETSIWAPIHCIHSVFLELEGAISAFSKRQSTKYKQVQGNGRKVDDHKSTDHNPSNLKFQVNMNVNTNTTMDINMNINANKSKLNPNNITRKEVESLKFELKLLDEKNKKLSKLNKDLQQEITTLGAKYQSQYTNLKQKMVKQFEDYKLKKTQQVVTLQSQLSHFRSAGRNALNDVELKQIRKDNERLSTHNAELITKHNKLMDKIAAMQLAMEYSKTRYKTLQSKYDLETFNYDKYQADIGALKEQILQKENIIDHSHQIVNSLLKNTISDLIPYNEPLNEIEGSHNAVTHKHSIDRSLIRMDALKISELIAWQNYATKFHLAMDLLSEYELTSRRSRNRMKNVVFMLGEKVKSLNIHNLTPSELIHLSRDLKQSFESIASEQHLKEYELSNSRKEFMKHKTLAPPILTPMMSPFVHSVGDDDVLPQSAPIDDHQYAISFSSMASLSMLDIMNPPEHLSRNVSLHSLSPSLDGTESMIAKHRTKSGSIKGSGLRLLTDQDTLKSYLDPKQKKIRQRTNKHGISRSLSHQALSHNKPGKTGKKFNHYSAFNNTRNRKSGKRHNKNPSNSSISQSRSIYGYHDSQRSSRTRKDNRSITSLSALSVEDDDTDTVVLVESPRLENHYNSDLAIDEGLENDDSHAALLNNKVLSNDILSFFAM